MTTTNETPGVNTPPANNNGVDRDLIAKLTADGNRGLNLDSPVVHKGKSYTVAQLLENNEKLSQLEPVQASQTSLLAAIKTAFIEDAADDDARAEALSSALKSAGASDDQISELVSAFRQEAGGEVEDDVEQPPARRSKGKPGEPDPTMKRFMDTLEEDRDEMFEEIITTGAEKAVTGDGYFKDLISKFKDVGVLDDAKAKVAVETYKTQIIEEAKRGAIRKLNSSGGKSLRAKDVKEALTKATERVYNNLRAVIPDGSLIGRTGETASTVDDHIMSLIGENPVEYKIDRKMSPEQIRDAGDTASRDVLARAVRDLAVASKGEDSRA